MKFIKEIKADLLKYILPNKCSEKEKNANPISAEEVVEALRSGKAVEIINAIIKGPLIIKSMIIEGKVTIEQTNIKGFVDCSYTMFKKVLSLKHSTFENDANFNAVTIEKDFFLDEATFLGEANFLNLIVMGIFYGRATRFKKGAIFNEATFKKSIDLQKSIFEEGEADFLNAQIGTYATFHGAIFKRKARFNSVRIAGAAFFSEATFEGEADLVDAQIGSNADFTEAVFKQKASFNGAQIAGTAFFSPAIFEGEADFISIRIGRNAEFMKVVFKQMVIFNNARIAEVAFFSEATFEEEARFTCAQIGRNADFTKAVFKHKVIFSGAQIAEVAIFNEATFEGEAEFISVRIGSTANFTSARFKEDTVFYASQFKLDTRFVGSVFFKKVSFWNTSFGTVLFELDHSVTIFHGKINFLGCTYDRIDPLTIWEELVERFDKYDRQPFTQLEETFRQAGEERLANKVYYKRRLREAARIKIRKHPIAWIGNWFLRLLTGYGVKLGRLLIPIILIIALGTLVFLRDGAIKPKQCTQPISCSKSEAFWVSLRYFLPVDIPSGANWEPTDSNIWKIQNRWCKWMSIKYTTVATLLKLAGWILIPIAVAGLTGILKR